MNDPRIEHLAIALGLALFATISACSPTSPVGDGGDEDLDGGPGDDAGETLGDRCTSSAECGSDAPTCVPIRAAAYAPGVCASACDESPCEGSGECRAGSCIQCSTEIAGTIPLGGDCGCTTDCAMGECRDGACFLDCFHDPCPTGFSCDGTPPGCRACGGGEPASEGGACGCDEDCGSGLECLGGFCLRACFYDEMCGIDECRHELSGPSSCDAPEGSCVGGGTGAAGDECVCNADCGPTAPFCLGVGAGDTYRRVCSNTCGRKQPCPSGTDCCALIPGYDYCIDATVASESGATCS